MRKGAIPDIRGLPLVHTGTMPTEKLSSDIRQLKEAKVGGFAALEDASARTAAVEKARRGVEIRDREPSDSHDRFFEIKRSRGAGVRQTERLGLLADPSLIERPNDDPRPLTVIVEEIVGPTDVQGQCLRSATTALNAG